jgi:hypothetical protein
MIWQEVCVKQRGLVRTLVWKKQVRSSAASTEREGELAGSRDGHR